MSAEKGQRRPGATDVTTTTDPGHNNEEDLSSLLNHLDGLIAKKRLKTIAGDLA